MRQNELSQLSAKAAATNLLVFLIPSDRACRHRIDVIELRFDHPRREWCPDTRLRRHGFLAGFG
jgi:hypothetical protein